MLKASNIAGAAHPSFGTREPGGGDATVAVPADDEDAVPVASGGGRTARSLRSASFGHPTSQKAWAVRPHSASARCAAAIQTWVSRPPPPSGERHWRRAVWIPASAAAQTTSSSVSVRQADVSVVHAVLIDTFGARIRGDGVHEPLDIGSGQGAPLRCCEAGAGLEARPPHLSTKMLDFCSRHVRQLLRRRFWRPAWSLNLVIFRLRSYVVEN